MIKQIIGYMIDGSDRMLSPSQTRLRILGTGKYLSVPKNHNMWTPEFTKANGIEPVYGAEPPECDPQTQVTRRGAPKRDENGMLIETYDIVSRFDSLDAWKENMIQMVKRECKRRRDKGITVNGLPIKTDSEGLALLNTSVSSVEDKCFVVGDEVLTISFVELAAAKEAADKYIQDCFSALGKFISEIKERDSIQPIDINRHWPN